MSIFNGREEKRIADDIRHTFIDAHRLFITEDFRNYIFECCREKYADSENRPPFNHTRTFISGFMTRNRFSFWRQHFKRSRDR
jgi:hypothetical protein